MESRLRRLGRETKIFRVDSMQWEVIKNEYLPGGILSVFLGKSRSLVKEEEIFKSKMGNWMAIKLYHKGRILVVINIY